MTNKLNISSVQHGCSTEEAREALKVILRYIGENPSREGLRDTPDRILRMFDEIYRGYKPEAMPRLTVFPNNADEVDYNGVVTDSGTFHSVCEHHMMPFFGHYWFGYIPNPQGKILGISKVGRSVDYCAARLQIQERLAKDIISMIADALGAEFPPLAIGIVLEGEHLCKTMRGVKKQGTMRTSCFRGDKEAVRELKDELARFMSVLPR